MQFIEVYTVKFFAFLRITLWRTEAQMKFQRNSFCSNTELQPKVQYFQSLASQNLEEFLRVHNIFYEFSRIIKKKVVKLQKAIL